MSQISADTKHNLAKAFVDSGLLQFGEFTLKSGLKSPFYIDLRKAQSNPDAFHIIIDTYIEMLADAPTTIKLAGIPEAATPFAAAVGYVKKIPMVQPRKVVKSHGNKKSVEGEFESGDKVILLDDLVTTGESKLETIKQVEAAGLKVERLVVLFNRPQGGIDAVTEAGYHIEAAMTLQELMDILLKSKRIDKKRYEEIIEYLKN